MTSAIQITEILMFIANIVSCLMVLLLAVIIWLMLARNKQGQKLISLCDSINQQNLARTAEEAPNGTKEVKQSIGSAKRHRVLSKIRPQRQNRDFKFRISVSLRERQNNAKQCDSYHENGVPPGIAADSTEENASEQYWQPQEKCEISTRTLGLSGLNSANQHLSSSKTSLSSVAVQTDETHVEDRGEKASSQKRQNLEIITDNTGLEDKNDEEEHLRRQGGSSGRPGTADNSGCEVTTCSETYSEGEEKQAQISLPNRDVVLSSDFFLEEDPEEKDSKAQQVPVYAAVNRHEEKENDNEESKDGPEERGNDEEKSGESQIEDLPDQKNAASQDDSSEQGYILDEEHEGRDPYQIQVSDPEERDSKAQPVPVHAAVNRHEEKENDNEESEDGPEERGSDDEKSGESQIEDLPDQKNAASQDDSSEQGYILDEEDKGREPYQIQISDPEERDAKAQPVTVHAAVDRHEEKENDEEDSVDGPEERGNDKEKRGESQIEDLPDQKNAASQDDSSEQGYILDEEDQGRDPYQIQVSGPEERNAKAEPVTVHATVNRLGKRGDDNEGGGINGKISKNGDDFKENSDEERGDDYEERRGNDDKERGSSYEDRGSNDDYAREGHEEKGGDLKDERNDEGIGCGHEESGNDDDDGDDDEGAHCHNEKVNDNEARPDEQEGKGSYHEKREDGPKERRNEEEERGKSQIENLPDQDNAASEDDSSGQDYISDEKHKGRDLYPVQVSGEEDLSKSEDDSTNGPGSLTQISVENGEVNISVENFRQADETDGQLKYLLVQSIGTNCKVIKSDRNGGKTEEFIPLSEKSTIRRYISDKVAVQIGEENTFSDADGFTSILSSGQDGKPHHSEVCTTLTPVEDYVSRHRYWSNNYEDSQNRNNKCLKLKVLLSRRILKHVKKRRKQNPVDTANKIRDCNWVPEIRYLKPDEPETVSNKSDQEEREFESTSNFVNFLLFYIHYESMESIFRLLNADRVIATSDDCLLLETNKPEKLKSMIYNSDFVRKEILLLLRKEDIFNNGLRVLQSDVTFEINM